MQHIIYPVVFYKIAFEQNRNKIIYAREPPEGVNHVNFYTNLLNLMKGG